MKIAYLVMRYPWVSQTFIEREMLALAAQGLEIEVWPIRDFRSAAHLPPTPAALKVVRAGPLWRLLPAMLGGAIREIRRQPALLSRGWRLFWRYRPRHAEGWFMTLWGTLFALARAESARARPPDLFHGAWATAPATAAAVLGELCGRPFSFGGHAYDLHRRGGDPLLPAKMDAARFVHTTTQANVSDLQARFPAHRAPIVLARRGLSAGFFARAGESAADRLAMDASATSRARPFRLLSVGRLVEKKGHRYQIAACSELARRGFAFRLCIIGEGPEHLDLRARITGAGLEDRIDLAGERSPAEVLDALAEADAFWHTGIIDAQGDRDGLPNVIPEAMAHALPVISSRAGGAAEAIENDQTGLLVDPTDARALADAVQRLAADHAWRTKLGVAGRAWVAQNFLAESNTRRLAEVFRAIK